MFKDFLIKGLLLDLFPLEVPLRGPQPAGHMGEEAKDDQFLEETLRRNSRLLKLKLEEDLVVKYTLDCNVLLLTLAPEE